MDESTDDVIRGMRAARRANFESAVASLQKAETVDRGELNPAERARLTAEIQSAMQAKLLLSDKFATALVARLAETAAELEGKSIDERLAVTAGITRELLNSMFWETT